MYSSLSQDLGINYTLPSCDPGHTECPGTGVGIKKTIKQELSFAQATISQALVSDQTEPRPRLPTLINGTEIFEQILCDEA